MLAEWETFLEGIVASPRPPPVEHHDFAVDASNFSLSISSSSSWCHPDDSDGGSGDRSGIDKDWGKWRHRVSGINDEEFGDGSIVIHDCKGGSVNFSVCGAPHGKNVDEVIDATSNGSVNGSVNNSVNDSVNDSVNASAYDSVNDSVVGAVNTNDHGVGNSSVHGDVSNATHHDATSVVNDCADKNAGEVEHSVAYASAGVSARNASHAADMEREAQGLPQSTHKMDLTEISERQHMVKEHDQRSLPELLYALDISMEPGYDGRVRGIAFAQVGACRHNRMIRFDYVGDCFTAFDHSLFRFGRSVRGASYYFITCRDKRRVQ